MPDDNIVTLRHMRSGDSGKVVEVNGGLGLVNRLSAMGLRPGKRLTKISSMLMRGPVTIKVGNTRLAIGHGMASRILVKLDGSK